MGSKEKILISLPSDIVEKLRSYATKKGTISEIVEMALRQYFGNSISDDELEDRLIIFEYEFNKVINNNDNNGDAVLELFNTLIAVKSRYTNSKYAERYMNLYNKIKDILTNLIRTDNKINNNGNNNSSNNIIVLYRCKECKHVKGRRLTAFCTCDCHYGEVDESQFERVEVNQQKV